jgi:4-hydroxy-2-oxoglutarate aldolase
LLHTAPFTVLGGATDYLLGALAVGGKGAITGMANVAPRVCAKVFELHKLGKMDEALELAGSISRAEWSLGKGGILGTKVCPNLTVSGEADIAQYAVQWSNQYPESAAAGRKPLPQVVEASKKHVEAECGPILKLERALEKEGYVGLGLRST